MSAIPDYECSQISYKSHDYGISDKYKKMISRRIEPNTSGQSHDIIPTMKSAIYQLYLGNGMGSGKLCGLMG